MLFKIDKFRFLHFVIFFLQNIKNSEKQSQGFYSYHRMREKHHQKANNSSIASIHSHSLFCLKERCSCPLLLQYLAFKSTPP